MQHDLPSRSQIKGYEGKITLLESQLENLKKRHAETVRQTAKHPELIRALERELDEEIEKTQRKRQELENLRQEQERAKEETQKRQELEEAVARGRRREEEREAQKRQEQWESDRRQKFELELAAQQEAEERRLKQTENDLKGIYEQKIQKHELKAENTIQGLLSQGVKQLAEAQLTLDHIISPSMIDGVRQLGDAQCENLLWMVRSISQTLERAEKKLMYADVVQVEGGLANGHKQPFNEPL